MEIGMIVLGISGLYHDSAAAIVDDGRIIAAVQEERFSRKKHDNRVPVNAINYCLKMAGKSMDEVDEVVYYDNPVLTLDRFLKNAEALGASSRDMVERGFENTFSDRLWIAEHLRKIYGSLGKEDKLYVTEHHVSHAASAFYPSPFESAAVLTIDGVGEWATTTISHGVGNDITMLQEIRYPHSIGLMYSAFTAFCGFKVNEGDYKFMGLAPYGEPVYYDVIKEKLIDVKPDGSYKLNLDYFDFYKSEYMVNDKFAALFGGPKREPESNITKREMDIAASAQKVTEEVVLLLARHAREITGEKNLCMAGGVALNCVANGNIMEEGIFDNIWVQPAGGDGGGALGCALYAAFKHGTAKRVPDPDDSQQGSYLGCRFTNEEIMKYLDDNGYVYHYLGEDSNKEVARLLADEKIIGRFAGAMEFGPRALGNRSIIADPRSEEMQSKLNLKIKYRESFRPFAPSVLEEDIHEYFDIRDVSPYMLMVAPVKKERQIPFDLGEKLTYTDYDMLPIVNARRSDIPAVTHVDYSARIQSVSEKRNPKYYELIAEFKKLTGCSVIVNTSFNVRGEPIVCTPEDAYKCFMRTEMDVLVLEDCILYKEEQPRFEEKGNWRDEYELD
jgi:carbamoyltransferase